MTNITTQNWDGVTAPAIPAGWTLVPSSGSNIVTTTTLNEGVNSLAQFTGTNAVVAAMYSTATDGNGGNCSVACDFAINSDSADQYIILRANSPSAPTTFYAARLQITGTDSSTSPWNANAHYGFSIGKYVASTPTGLTAPPAGQLTNFLANTWYRMTLTAIGSSLNLVVTRPSDGFYLTTAGVWQAGATVTATATDTAITGAGYAGVGFFKAVATTSAKVIYSDLFSFDTAGATSYTLTGPSVVSVGVASSNFTVTPNAAYGGVITPSDGGAGGTFTPTSLTFAGTSAAQTFTYTPLAAGSVTISATSSPAITDPSPLSVTAHAATTYYVSPTGSDSANGTSTSTPFQTVGHVNGLTLYAGDQVLFQSGQTFAGSLTFASLAGSAAAPILFGIYGGSTVATINAGDSNGTALGGGGAGDGWGVRLTNCSRVTVQYLKFVGSGVVVATGASTSGSTNGTQSPSNNTVGVGVDIVSDTHAATTYPGVTISHVEVTGFYEGCYVRCVPASGSADPYTSLTISNCSIHDCLHFGIYTYGGAPASRGGGTFNFYNNFGAITGLHIADTTVYNVPGDPLNTIASGVMMQINNVDGGLIERCCVHDGTSLVGRGAVVGVGPADYGSFSSGGGGGIIPLLCRNVTVQDCEAYLLTTGLSYDGCGFDLDGSTVGCVVQRCYSHDNYGAGFQAGAVNGNTPANSANVFRYNLSVNDARNPQTGSPAQAALRNFGGSVGCVWHNNTVYLAASAAGTQPSCFRGVSGSDANKVFNNIFITTGGPFFCAALTQDTLTGNLYYDVGSSPKWSKSDGTTYVTLALFRAANASWENGGPASASGMLANPLVRTAGDHATLGQGNPPYNYTAYDLLVGSPAIDAAISLLYLSVAPASTDIHRASVPAGFASDIGAMEYGATGGGSGSGGGITIGHMSMALV